MAKSFHFTLERVLEYRRRMEDQAVLALSKAQAAYVAQAAKIDDLRSKLNDMAAELAACRITAAELRLWIAYRDGLDSDLRHAEALLLQLARELSVKRQEAVRKRKERKILEELKEKKRILHVKTEDYNEQKEFDELSTIRRRPEAV